MEQIILEFAKFGCIALAFGVLLFALLRDKDRMASELKEDKAKVLDAFVKNMEYVKGLTEALNRRPCTRGELEDGRIIRGEEQRQRDRAAL